MRAPLGLRFERRLSTPPWLPIAVPLGFRKARLELEKSQPDYAIVRSRGTSKIDTTGPLARRITQ